MFGLLMVVLLVGADPASTAPKAADPASQLLAKRNFPWFDAEKQVFRPLKPPTDLPATPSSDKLVDPNLGNGLSFIAKICLYLVLAVVLGWLVYLFYQSLDSMASPPELEPVGQTLDPAKLEALPAGVRNVTDFLAEAQRLAQESDFNSAMVFYFSWQLVTLNQEGVLELEVGKTNRQYLWETSQNRPELKPLFYQSTRLFEESFYGGVSIGREQFQELWSSREEFRKRSLAPGRRR